MQTGATQSYYGHFMPCIYQSGGTLAAGSRGGNDIIYEQNPLWAEEAIQSKGPCEIVLTLLTA